ncbi:flagellar hook-basal body complex protein [Acidiferrimicrobium sp. IK]|uniref:flagellar hook-basal body protein n=1 Tax=Acidiferrimicrobium sp. IK TaxID=2871700 RepID=UPI0021CB387A|nr:flagellar hook-basal body complex protein [Acidiferrimicrobium sp. IK]MCU4185036.1 flagellar hook-basal body complex protein [Acidiferrimicrobium sp. IK]
MEQSLLAATSGIQSSQTYLDVIGNNIANSNTTAYESQNVYFTDLLSQQLTGATAPSTVAGGVNPLTVGAGVRVGAIAGSQSQGAPQATGIPSNVAIQGSGYLVVVQNGQQLYTRAGDLSLDANGNLVTPTGGMVQGWEATGGAITNTGATGTVSIPPKLTNTAGATLASYSIGSDGVITGSFSDGSTQPIAQLALATVTNPNGLSSVGASMYSLSANSGAATVGVPGTGGRGTFLGGSLESSNVDLATELTNLIVAQESYQANTKVVSSTSATLQSLMQMQ